MNRSRLKSKKQSKEDFSGLDFKNETFEGIDFHESIFNGAYFSNVRFVNCDMRHTEFTESKLTNCEFIDSSLDYSDFVYTQASRVNFTRCTFSQVEWRENILVQLRFRECTFVNSTISLCSFKGASFDPISSSSFCSASKRFNVFSETDFTLPKNKIDFLRNNYGIVFGEPNSRFVTDDEYQDDFLLSLSLLKFADRVNSEIFIDLILKAVDALSGAGGKNHIQKAKYISLICRQVVEGKVLSVFAQQLLINSLNSACKDISDSQTFMEMVNLIMFMKTHQFNAVRAIESDARDFEDETVKGILLQFRLTNSYEEGDVQNYLQQMASYLMIPTERISISQFRIGSTIFDLIINHSASLVSVLVFIHLSLSQANKILEGVLKMKKNLKSLRNKTKIRKVKTIMVQRARDATPLSIMLNQGSFNYDRINSIVTQFKRAVTKIDGKGEVTIKISTRRTEP